VETRRLLIGCDFTYVAAIPTPVIFHVQPLGSPLISIEGAQWGSEPAFAARRYTDLYGNPCVRAVLPAGHLTFQYGSSTALSSAVDVNLAGRGVCRDFTHLAISFCRALNIPARYVFGYLPDMDVPPDPAPMDFAAWMEVWLGDRWWTFDPRNNTRRKGRIVIGQGRDASDVAMATTFGGPLLESMLVQAEEEATG
jgi:transglutaminase-like putative cysteine protease